MAKKKTKLMDRAVDPAFAEAVERGLALPLPVYAVEGPISERREVKTPWGPAWAEVGCYIAERMEGKVPTGEFHIIHPDDYEREYRPSVEKGRA